MTNAEYKEFAKKVLKDIELDDDKPKIRNISITNIGEIFALNIIEGIANLDENTFPHRGADKVNNTFLSLVNSKIANRKESVGGLPPSNTTLTFISYIAFMGLRSAISNHSNPEYMLQNLGVEDARDFIFEVNNIDNINDDEESFNAILDIYGRLSDIIGWDNLWKISCWGMVSFYGRNIIELFKDLSPKEILYFFKLAKYISNKYHSICKERVVIIQSTIKFVFNNEYNNIEDFIPQDIIDTVIKNYAKFKSFEKMNASIGTEDDAIPTEIEEKYKYLALDGLFVLYYYIYERPQSIVKLGFNLMSDKVSSNISGAMISSFRKQDYAGLIQYEYEWWCNETGERLSLPFPFFEGQLNLSGISIVDYDLDKKKAPLQIIVKDDNLSYIDSESPDKDTEQHFGLALKSSEVEYLYNELKGTFLDANTDIRLFCYRLTGKGKPDKIENLKWIVDDKSLGVFIQTLGVSKEKCWKKTESFFGTKTNNIKAYYSRNTDPKGILQTNETNSNKIYNIVKKIL